MTRIALIAALTVISGSPVRATGSLDASPGILGYSPRAAAVQRDVEPSVW